MRSELRGLAGALVFFVLSACGPLEPLESGASVNTVEPFERPTVPIRFSAMRADFSRGDEVGTYQSMLWTCYAPTDYLHWGLGQLQELGGDWPDFTQRTLRDAGFSVPSDPGNVFGDLDHDRRSATYLLGGRITALDLDVCEHLDWATGDLLYQQSGTASIEIEWTLFNAIRRSVVFRTTTQGSGEVDRRRPLGIQNLVDRSFREAMQRLAVEPEFRAFVAQRPDPRTAVALDRQESGMSLRSQPLFERPFDEHGEELRASVVTIGDATSHGSGFFVSRELVLTNAHVVRGNRQVALRTHTGRRIMGDVIRRNTPRDVALIRVERAGHAPLPIRAEAARVGETVFAIGTPLQRGLRGTVSRGVVSAYRENREGFQDIQADVDVHGGNSGGPLLDARGNVVGLTYAGISGDAAGTSIGLNLFIPIEDAFARLGISLLPGDGAPGLEYSSQSTP